MLTLTITTEWHVNLCMRCMISFFSSFVYLLCLPFLPFDFFLIFVDHVLDHELVVRTLKKGLMLQFLLIGPVFLISLIDIICFGLHVIISFIPCDDDDYYTSY